MGGAMNISESIVKQRQNIADSITDSYWTLI
jgi:hypothetical protein